MGITEILVGILLALLAALGLTWGRLKSKDAKVAQANADRATAVTAQEEHTRQQAQAAEANADREYHETIDKKTRTDFRNNPPQS